MRDIFVATPPGYTTGTMRHPVVYLQDGQNLFDPALSFAGHWGMLETLAATRVEPAPIIVGIPNLGRGRLREYSPFDDVIHGEGEADAYLDYLRSVVKPMIDRSFRTRPEREWTTIGGSSMGGLLSLYALIAAAGTFGSAWVMSPAFWYGDGQIYDWLAHQPGPVGRIWLDVGLDEGPDEVEDVRRMRDLLVARGWRLGDTFHYHEDPPGDHDEATWGRRVRELWARLIGMLAPRPGAFPRSRDLP
jgi:isoamylase